MRFLPSTIPVTLALVCALAPAGAFAASEDGHQGRHAHQRGERHEKLLAKFDADKDGKIDHGEGKAVKAAHQEHHAEREAKLKEKHPELFAKIDKDQDGHIDHGEGKAFREERREERREHHQR